MDLRGYLSYSLPAAQFREALSIDPHNVRTLSHYGTFLYTGCVEYERAAECFEKALRIDDSHVLTLCCNELFFH